MNENSEYSIIFLKKKLYYFVFLKEYLNFNDYKGYKTQKTVKKGTGFTTKHKNRENTSLFLFFYVVYSI